MTAKTLGEIAKLVKGEVLGDPDVIVTDISGLEDVEYGEMTWAEKEKFFSIAADSPASAVLLPKDVLTFKKPAVRVENPRLAFSTILDAFHPPRRFNENIHPSAVIGEGCKIAEGCYIGPNCVIEEGTVLGKRVALYANIYIGPKVKIGEGTVIHANVTIREGVQIGKNVIVHAGSVIGSDGFGFVTVQGKHKKVPQVGNVIIQDDVEIGANCTIDRATTGSTVISKGTKTDNLVQIAHNVLVGEDCLLVAQSGIAGSVKVGHHVTLAGQSGIAGHISVGEHSIIAAKSVVLANLPPRSFVSGYPARPHQEELKVKASIRKVPDLLKRVSELEKKLSELERREAELDLV